MISAYESFDCIHCTNMIYASFHCELRKRKRENYVTKLPEFSYVETGKDGEDEWRRQSHPVGDQVYLLSHNAVMLHREAFGQNMAKTWLHIHGVQECEM